MQVFMVGILPYLDGNESDELLILGLKVSNVHEQHI